MAGIVRIIPIDKAFFAAGHDSILDAALHAGLSLNYGCSNGNCGLCKGRVISGQVTRVRHHDFVITASEKSRGYVLLCSYAPAGDVVVEADATTHSVDIPIQKIPAKVKTLRPLDEDISALHIQTPRTHRFRFMAGQEVQLKLASGSAFVYPIASCPCEDRNLEFHFRKTGDGKILQELLQLGHGDTIEMEGPTGNFTLGAVTSKNLVFVAWDIGFAPIKSLIEHALQQEDIQCELHLYCLLPGGTQPYFTNIVRAWSDAFDQFTYTPLCLADEYEQVIADLEDGGARFCETIEPRIRKLVSTDSCSVYIAGPEPVPELVRPMLVRAGVAEDKVNTAVINPV